MWQAKKERRTQVGGLRQRVEVLEQDNREPSEAKTLCPQSQRVFGLSSNFRELIAVVCLRYGSRVMGGLSEPALANVAVRDSSDDFTLTIGGHCYRCQSSVPQFSSARVSKFH
jgi:hypothetical protein